MSYIGNKRAVTHQRITLPFVDAATNNVIIREDGTLEGVDFTPINSQISSIQNQINSIEEDITSLDTSIGVVEDAIDQPVSFPAGHVVQVVYAESTTATSITSTTQGSGTSTGLSVTITPVSSSNKFFISYVGSFRLANHTNPAVSIEIYDGSSVVASENGTWGIYINGDGNEYDNTWKYPFQTYITPSGSGSITYTVRAWKHGNAVTAQPNSRLSTLTIMEIQQ